MGVLLKIGARLVNELICMLVIRFNLSAFLPGYLAGAWRILHKTAIGTKVISRQIFKSTSGLIIVARIEDGTNHRSACKIALDSSSDTRPRAVNLIVPSGLIKNVVGIELTPEKGAGRGWPPRDATE